MDATKLCIWICISRKSGGQVNKPLEDEWCIQIGNIVSENKMCYKHRFRCFVLFYLSLFVLSNSYLQACAYFILEIFLSFLAHQVYREFPQLFDVKRISLNLCVYAPTKFFKTVFINNFRGYFITLKYRLNSYMI